MTDMKYQDIFSSSKYSTLCLSVIEQPKSPFSHIIGDIIPEEFWMLYRGTWRGFFHETKKVFLLNSMVLTVPEFNCSRFC